MPTPVGPVPIDPDDPDFWNWDEDHDDDLRPSRRIWRIFVVGIVVVGLLLLLFASIL